MTVTQNLYQSILKNLSSVSIQVLTEIDDFLKKSQKSKVVVKNVREDTLAFAGSWSDMSDNDPKY